MIIETTNPPRRVHDRRRYQLEVERLLEQIDGQLSRLRRLKAWGVNGPALAEGKRELARTRQRLASLTRPVSARA